MNFADEEDDYADDDLLSPRYQQHQQQQPQQQQQHFNRHKTMAYSGYNSISSTSTGYRTAFSKLRKLSWLDVSDNRISHIAPNYLPRIIITLNLSDNLFTEVPVNMLQHLHQLRSLFMRNNLLKTLANIEDYPSAMLLERIDFSYNTIDDVQHLFNANSTIKIIILEKNWIRQLKARAFYNLSTSRIALAYNRITHIDNDAFNGLEQTLEHLDLEHNRFV